MIAWSFVTIKRIYKFRRKCNYNSQISVYYMFIFYFFLFVQVDLPEVETEESEKLRHFINYLQSEKAWPAIIKVITEPNIWQQFLVNDKTENALSYYELLHHVKAQLK